MSSIASVRQTVACPAWFALDPGALCSPWRKIGNNEELAAGAKVLQFINAEGASLDSTGLAALLAESDLCDSSAWLEAAIVATGGARTASRHMLP